MRGLLRDKRSQTLAWMLAMLGAIIILSPLSSLADSNSGTLQPLYTKGNFLTQYFDATPVSDCNSGTFIPCYARTFYFDYNLSGNVPSVTSTMIVDASSTSLLPLDLPLDFLTSSTQASGIGIWFCPTPDASDSDCVTEINATNLSTGQRLFYSADALPNGSTTIIISSTLLMTTSTDTIVGNVFNQIYLLGWFFFFIIVFWITFKITKR